MHCISSKLPHGMVCVKIGPNYDKLTVQLGEDFRGQGGQHALDTLASLFEKTYDCGRVVHRARDQCSDHIGVPPTN
jgi:hypothetical protein